MPWKTGAERGLFSQLHLAMQNIKCRVAALSVRGYSAVPESGRDVELDPEDPWTVQCDLHSFVQRIANGGTTNEAVWGAGDKCAPTPANGPRVRVWRVSRAMATRLVAVLGCDSCMHAPDPFCRRPPTEFGHVEVAG